MEFKLDLSPNTEITDSSSSFETNEIKIPLAKPTAIAKLSKSVFDDSSSQNSFVYSENSTESFKPEGIEIPRCKNPTLSQNSFVYSDSSIESFGTKNFIKSVGIEIPKRKNSILSQANSFITSGFDSSSQASIIQSPNENYFTYKF